MTPTDAHRAHLLDILRWRRDVRRFRTDPVPAATLAAVEAAVDLAPSVGNSRPWRVVRVADPARRRAVLASHRRADDAAATDYDGAARADYVALKLAGLAEAPVHYAFFTEPDPAAGRGLGRRTMPETLAYSTVIAIHTLWLAARAHGLGVGWVSILEPAAVTAALDVPAAWRLTGYLCVGWPEAEADTPELHRAGWQADAPTVWLDR